MEVRCVHVEQVAAIYYNTGRQFADIGQELGITRTTAERAHQHWHDLHPDEPGDIPHEATCSRSGNLSPEMRKKVLSRLQEDRTRAEVAGELGVAEKDVRWVQVQWARYNRKKGVRLKRCGCRRWRGKGG